MEEWMLIQIIRIIAVRKREKMENFFPSQPEWSLEVPLCTEFMHLHPGFEEEAYSCRDWEDIYVPAHIQMEGYDARSMPMSSIRGKAMKNFIRDRFRNV